MEYGVTFSSKKNFPKLSHVALGFQRENRARSHTGVFNILAADSFYPRFRIGNKREKGIVRFKSRYHSKFQMLVYGKLIPNL